MKSPNKTAKHGISGKLPSRVVRKEKAAHILERLSQVNPDPKTELYYQTPFQLLVSVVLSAQTTDKSVNKCMEPLYKAGFTPETVIKMGPDRFLAKIKTIGLAPTKSKNVVKLATIIRDEYDGKIPSTRAELEALPGVGRKTANVVLGEIFGEPTLAVDTHVYRLTARLGLQNEASPEKAEQELLHIMPADKLHKAHHWLILHGRYVCVARRPKCEECVLNDICPSAFRADEGPKTKGDVAPKARPAVKADLRRGRAKPAKAPKGADR